MTEATENLVLEILRAIRADIADLKRDNLDFKSRHTATESTLGSLHGAIGHLQVQIASQTGRLDHVEQQLEHINRRLGLVDA
ncbi:MAG TPA: hypothetical protein VMH86_14055 [Rhizomicrobium sp.]|nr:hypothetical protein [Rhizomicrobium sp.]